MSKSKTAKAVVGNFSSSSPRRSRSLRLTGSRARDAANSSSPGLWPTTITSENLPGSVFSIATILSALAR